MRKRRNEHLCDSRRGSKNRFHSALSELGEDSFDFEILERCPKELLLERERFYIVLLGSADLDGFNSRENPCATYDRTMSAISRARISASKKGWRPTAEQTARQAAAQIGLRRSEESKLKMSAAMRGIKKTEEHRRKLGAYRIGRKSSPETRAKQSAALKGRIFSAESIDKQRATRAARKALLGREYGNRLKPILVLDRNDKIAHVFESLMDAVVGLNNSNGNLRYYLKTSRPMKNGFRLYYATIERPENSGK